ncbi:hypothetical protein TMatcc_004444 [Talaromyces marneffei ATCC 18224]
MDTFGIGRSCPANTRALDPVSYFETHLVQKSMLLPSFTHLADRGMGEHHHPRPRLLPKEHFRP